jgi:TRAP-type C4-dicarboxylate transport system permease small subunit
MSAFESGQTIKKSFFLRNLASSSRFLEAGLHGVAGLCMVALMIAVFVEVVSRYIFHASFDFIQDISTWLMIWLTYLVAGVLIKYRQHIDINVGQDKLNKKIYLPMLVLADIACLAFGVLLAIASIQHIGLVKEAGILSVTTLKVPMWIIKICVPLGGVIIAIFSLGTLGKDVANLITPKARKS